ncbi:MAG TPA: hypothetical protein VHW24_25605, partial [Bryobacteraceae bacterium]|nr:hypothetical protein [Bryobacteraceae bacterium]
VNAKGRNWTDKTPLDRAAQSSDGDKRAEFADIASRLVRAGGEMTPRAAASAMRTGSSKYTSRKPCSSRTRT